MINSEGSGCGHDLGEGQEMPAQGHFDAGDQESVLFPEMHDGVFVTAEDETAFLFQGKGFVFKKHGVNRCNFLSLPRKIDACTFNI